MSTLINDPQAALRRSLYYLLIAVGVGAMLGRILAVDSVDKAGVQEYQISRALQQKSAALEEKGLRAAALEEALDREEQRLRGRIQLRRPFLSANDRSRWGTIRALVEPELRVAGAPYAIDKVIEQPNWDTIDMVKHDGHLYSSKPPLLSTLIAGVYWVVCQLRGATLGSDPYFVGRTMLVLVNLVPLLIYFVLLGRLVERLGTTDWGRLFVMAAAVFGTFLTTFVVSANNHLPAAVFALAALYAAVPTWFDDRPSWAALAVAGFCGALMVASELPAASLFAALSLALLWKAPRTTLLAYVPAALLVATAFFFTNWLAHGTLMPAYAHRGTNEAGDWYNYTYTRNGKQYDSYWKDPVGLDRGEPSRAVYAMHVLVGHHGIFSLTPMWLLSVAGAAMWLWRPPQRRLRELAAVVAAASLVCLAFYLQQPLINRNYGGMTSGLRWMFWLAPLWLVVMLPAADFLAARRWTRVLGLLFLAASALSVAYPTWNPWTSPWIMDYLYYLGAG